MSDLILHAGKPWRIQFVAHNRAGAVQPLSSGSEVEFFIAGPTGLLLTKRLSEGSITVTDEQAGEGQVDISAGEQIANGLTYDVPLRYELDVTVGNDTMVEAEGRLIIRSSLSADIDPLIFQFEARFPEINDVEASDIAMAIDDAARQVDADGTFGDPDASPPDPDRTEAILLLAAHAMLMRKTRASQYAAGSAGSEQISSIRVADESVSFLNPYAAAAQSKFSLGQTVYGSAYLTLLRRKPRFVLRA